VHRCKWWSALPPCSLPVPHVPLPLVDHAASPAQGVTLKHALTLAEVAAVALGIIGSWLVFARATRVRGAQRDLAAGARVTLGDLIPLERDGRLACEGCLPLEQSAKLGGSTLFRDVGA
jgi:hypothetical protein